MPPMRNVAGLVDDSELMDDALKIRCNFSFGHSHSFGDASVLRHALGRWQAQGFIRRDL